LKNKSSDISEIFGIHAQSYVDKYFSVDRYTNALELFYTKAKPEGHYLDLACGPGNLTHHLLEHLPGAEVLGTDVAEEMLVHARQINPKAKFQNLACAEIRSIQQSFDGILCGFVLPYLAKEEAEILIADCARILNENGLILISGNLGDYEQSQKQNASTGDGPQLYSFNYPIDFLEQTLRSNGFKILKSFEYHHSYDGFEAEEVVIVAERH